MAAGRHLGQKKAVFTRLDHLSTLYADRRPVSTDKRVKGPGIYTAAYMETGTAAVYKLKWRTDQH